MNHVTISQKQNGTLHTQEDDSTEAKARPSCFWNRNSNTTRVNPTETVCLLIALLASYLILTTIPHTAATVIPLIHMLAPMPLCSDSS